ncbi:unnamed protein product [Mesocestoides corti]|uniref:Annexin n=1 Tax=Mesocestoides corti TaxID=53468 RepID=A0A0R3UJ24_MESCO|nr:unnamed protein product [Mesocestoides corti]
MTSGATVFEARNMNANEDAKELEKAMKGLVTTYIIGTNEQKIIDILANRSVRQRNEIAKAYKAAYGKDLKERLHSELSGNFRRAVLYSFYDKAHVNAKACYKAMKGAGTDEQILIDTICTSDNAEIDCLKKAYTDTVRRNLETDVKGDVSGDLERVLVALLQGKRETECDPTQVTKDAEELYQGGEKKLGTDESLFTRILVTRSYKAIRSINEAYAKANGIGTFRFISTTYKLIVLQAVGHDLIRAIEKETSGDYKRALITIVKTAINKNECIADILYNSMAGAGTHDDNLIRVIMAYSETSLAEIRNTFNTKYTKKPLNEMVKDDTSGDYRKFLLAILGTDEQAIIDILSCRSLSQRQRIEAAFKSIYGIDLKQKLHKELSGKFRLAVLYSFYDQAHVNAKSIYRAIKGAGTDETILIDVICSSTNEEIHELKKAYDDILKEKKQNPYLMNEFPKAVEIGHILFHRRLGTDEATFTNILVNCPWEEIVAIDTVYSQAVGHDLPTAIEKETSGDYKHALLALFKTAVSRERYYAEVLYKSMKGLGTHDENLVRMIMAHCEVDLANIKEVFETMYGKTLEDMVKSDTSGDQRKFLLAMMGARME